MIRLTNDRVTEARAAYLEELQRAAIPALAMARADELGAHGGEETSLAQLLKLLLEELGCTAELPPAPPLRFDTDDERRGRVVAALGLFFGWLAVATSHEAEFA